jgi:hypothetical protein
MSNSGGAEFSEFCVDLKYSMQLISHSDTKLYGRGHAQRSHHTIDFPPYHEAFKNNRVFTSYSSKVNTLALGAEIAGNPPGPYKE